MRRIVLLVAVLVILVGCGGAAAWVQHLRSTPRASEFDCLATAHDGWLTISAGNSNVHADWDSSGAHVDGIPGTPRVVDEAKARSVALDFTSPLKGKPSGAAHTATVHIFAMCDGASRWWSGTTVSRPSLKECLGDLRPRHALQCVRDFASAPAPAPASSEAYDVALKVWKATGVTPAPENPPSPRFHFPAPHGGPFFGGDDDDSLE
jgi:hypothetical protein